MNKSRITRSIRPMLRAGAPALLALASLLLLQCSETGTINPTPQEERLVFISELTATPNRVATGGSSSSIHGKVLDRFISDLLARRQTP